MFKQIKRLAERAAERVLDPRSQAVAASLSLEIDHLAAELGDCHHELQAAHAELEQAREQAERAQRHAEEYFQVVEDMHNEREQWKDMFFTQSRGHQGAQAMLGRALWLARKQLRLVAEALLKHDEDGAKALFERLEALDAPPIGEPQKFAEQMLELARSAKPQTDGLGAREQLAAAEGDASDR